MPNVLGLPHWQIVAKTSDDNDIHVTATYDVQPTVCPKCGVDKPRLYKHAVKEQTFMDTPMHGKRVGIVVQRPRFKCRECGETFQQELPDMDEKRRMTRRLVEYIGKAAIRRPFTEVAQDVGVHEKTVRLIFAEYAEQLESATHFETPEILGMDELYLARSRSPVVRLRVVRRALVSIAV